MNRMNHLDQVNWIAQLADLKQAHYHNSLLVNALIELLVEKGIMTAHDIATMSAQLDASLTPHPIDASLTHPVDTSRLHQPIDVPSSIPHPVDPTL
jgi:hypothetical protein